MHNLCHLQNPKEYDERYKNNIIIKDTPLKQENNWRSIPKYAKIVLIRYITEIKSGMNFIVLTSIFLSVNFNLAAFAKFASSI